MWCPTVSIGILGQVWYLIVSIPDPCTLTYFENTNGGPEGQIFISHPHTNNGFFFLLIILCENKLSEVPEYAENFAIHDDVKLTINDIT